MRCTEERGSDHMLTRYISRCCAQIEKSVWQPVVPLYIYIYVRIKPLEKNIKVAYAAPNGFIVSLFGAVSRSYSNEMCHCMEFVGENLTVFELQMQRFERRDMEY